MKKKLLFLILGLVGLTNQSFAQYQSIFGNDTTEWNGNYGIPDAEFSYSVKAYGDTIIKNLHYKYVGSNMYVSQINPPIGTGQLIGFIREDTTTGRVWNLYNGEEILLMDMSLSKGDTFTFNTLLSGSTPEYNIKLVVDTVYAFENRKYIGFDYNFWLSLISNHKLLFIEGIGARNMFCYLVNNNNWWAFITCVHKDGELVYGDNNSCLVYGLGLSNIDNNNNIKLYPNPTKGIINFDIEEEGIFHINIYNTLGVVVDKQTTTSKTIDLSSFKDDLYFVQIQTKKANYVSSIIKR